MTSYPFFKTAATASEFYFRFRFSWLFSNGKVDICLYRKISAWYPNHRPIYYYFRFLKTNVQVEILLPVPIFTVASPSACHSASAYQISSKSDHLRQSYDVLSISQNGGHGISILLPILVFVISLIWEGLYLPAHQISARYLNPRLRYYYFRFLKTNVRHYEILLPIPIFTFASL